MCTVVWILVAVSVLPIAVANGTAALTPCIVLVVGAAFLAAFGAPYPYQLATALAGALLSWFLARTAVTRQLRKASDVAWIDTVVGRTGTALTPIAGPEAQGTVRVGSTTWPARSDAPLQPGTEVVVEDLANGTLKVRPLQG